MTVAGRATQVRISGLKTAPNIGDVIEASAADKKIRFHKVKRGARDVGSLMRRRDGADDETAKKVNLIIKSDMLGSAEAIEESLEKLSTSEVRVEVLKKGLGSVTEGDIDRALAGKADVIGFNVTIPSAVQMLAREKGVTVKPYRIIYELVNDVKNKMESLLGTETMRHDMASVKILAVFKNEAAAQVGGVKIIFTLF